MKKSFNYQRERAQNPHTGIVSFNHFNGEKLYSDIIAQNTLATCETEDVECYPVPEGVPENGRNEGYYPDNTVAYIRCLWKDFEPKRGEYDYQFIQNIIDECKAHKQVLMFRLMPHSTCERDDVPDWLKEIIDCPKRPKGMREKASPKDKRFLEYFSQAIEKLGERFDKEPTFFMIDVCLTGAWGEGYELDKYDDEDVLKLIDTYVRVFPNTFLCGRFVRPNFLKYVAEKRPIGWRADGVGSPKHMDEIFPQRFPLIPQDLWKTSPVSAEAYWWIGEWFRKDWDIDKIINATLSWHVSTFNPKSLPIPFEWKDKIDDWNAKMGYHYDIKSVKFNQTVKLNGKLKVKLLVENCGVAPIYHKIPLNVKIKNAEFEKIFVTDVDIRTWLPAVNKEKLSISLEGVPAGSYQVQIGIGGMDYPTVYFATDAPFDNG